MQLLVIEDHGALLRLLFHCDTKSFAAFYADFAAVFSSPGARLRACCATLLLLEVRALGIGLLMLPLQPFQSEATLSVCYAYRRIRVH